MEYNDIKVTDLTIANKIIKLHTSGAITSEPHYEMTIIGRECAKEAQQKLLQLLFEQCPGHEGNVVFPRTKYACSHCRGLIRQIVEE